MPEARTSNIFGALLLSLGDEMRRSVHAELQVAGEASAAIVTIGNNPGHSLEWLSTALQITHSGIVRLTDRLVNDGFVEKRSARSDGRMLSLFLTRQGERQMGRILLARSATIDRALAALSRTEQETLSRFVEKMLIAVTTNELGDSMCRLCDERVCPQTQCPVTIACKRQEGRIGT